MQTKAMNILFLSALAITPALADSLSFNWLPGQFSGMIDYSAMQVSKCSTQACLASNNICTSVACSSCPTFRASCCLGLPTDPIACVQRVHPRDISSLTARTMKLTTRKAAATEHVVHHAAVNVVAQTSQWESGTETVPTGHQQYVMDGGAPTATENDIPEQTHAEHERSAEEDEAIEQLLREHYARLEVADRFD